jgi:hypothetical protein
MASDQVGVDSLYTGLNHRMILLGLLVLAMWLFAALSYYLSQKTGADWFSRSGSLMALAGAVASFRAVSVYQSRLAIALREGLMSVSREIELSLEPPTAFRIITYSGYVTGIVGTAIWGYGDLLLR